MTKYLTTESIGNHTWFNTLKDIAKAKAEIIDNLPVNGTIILNKDDKFFDYFKKIAEKKHIKVVSFGYSKKSDVTYDSLKTSQGGYILKVLVP